MICGEHKQREKKPCLYLPGKLHSTLAWHLSSRQSHTASSQLFMHTYSLVFVAAWRILQVQATCKIHAKNVSQSCKQSLNLLPGH